MIDRRTAMFGTVAAAGFAAGTGAGARQPDPVETIALWPGAAPGMPAVPPVETVDERSTDPALPDRAVRGIARPRLIMFRPKVANGSALLVAPGGGYARVVIDKDG